MWGSSITAGVLTRLKMKVAVVHQAGQVAEVTDRSQTLQLLSHVALFPTSVAPTHPIVEHSELGHAVGFAELLHLASIVAVQHLLTDARAVGTGSPRMILVTRSVVMSEDLCTVFTTEDQVLVVVANSVKKDLLLFTALANCKDIFLGFILITAGLTAEHRNTTLMTE